MRAPARVQFRKRVTQYTLALWIGVFAAWFFLLLIIAAIFGGRAINDPGILVIIMYLLFITGIIMLTIIPTIDRRASRPESVKCPQCACNIPPSEQWTCGYCGKLNEYQPLIAWCEHCLEEPASVLCPRDSYVIQLDHRPPTDGNHAVVETSALQITEASPIDQILEEKSRLEAETQTIKAETARLQAMAARKQAEGQLKDNEPASLDARLRQLMALKLELPDAKGRLIQELNEKYADDPDNLKAALANLEDLVEEIMDSEIAS